MACVTRKKGRWAVDFYDQHGTRRLRVLPKEATKKQANNLLREIEDQVSNGVFLPVKEIPPFAEVAEDWLNYKKMNVRDHTFSAYRCHVTKNLKPFFGHLKINRLGFGDIGRFVAEEHDRGASIYHLRKSLVLLSGIMQFAVRKRLIDANPVREVEKPRGISRHTPSDEIDVLRPDEIRLFLDNVEGLKYQTFFTIAVMTGARQGELIGLQWSDIDWYNAQVHIQRTFQHGRFYHPKTPTSRRKIDLGQTVVKQLKQWKMACPPSEQELVFPSDAGTPMKKENLVRRHFTPALRRAGLRKVRFHDLRHTFASLLIDQGEHPKYIQSQMGHSSINVTMDTYGHLMKSVNRLASSKLDEAVFGGNGDQMETKAQLKVVGGKVSD
jgi:integrase